MALRLFSGQETECFTNWQGGTSSPEHCRAAAGTLKLSRRLSVQVSLRRAADQAVLLMERSGYTASTALLQRSTSIRPPGHKDVLQPPSTAPPFCSILDASICSTVRLYRDYADIQYIYT